MTSLEALPRALADLLPDLDLRLADGDDAHRMPADRRRAAASCDVEVLLRPLRLARRGAAGAGGPRHQRAQGGGGADRPPRLSRRADRPAQPRRLRRSSRPRRRQGRRARRAARGPVHRPRRLQGGQRHSRPPGRRRAADRGRAPAARGGARRRAGRPRSAATSSRSSSRAAASRSHAGLLSERIVDALRQPFAIGGQQRRGSAPASASPSIPPMPTTPSDLIKNADMALYRAKAEGRGLTRFYEAAMDEALRQRRQLEADLRLAHRPRASSSVHYQPLAELGSGAITGFEALLRWDHPSAARSARKCSSGSPRRAASSSRSANGCCARPAPRRRAGPAAEARGQPLAAPVHAGRSGRSGRAGARRDRARPCAARARSDRGRC